MSPSELAEREDEEVAEEEPDTESKTRTHTKLWEQNMPGVIRIYEPMLQFFYSTIKPTRVIIDHPSGVTFLGKGF